MSLVPAPPEQSLPARPRRRALFSVVSLGLPIFALLLCAVTVPGSTRRGGEMFSSGLLICLFALVGGAIAGVVFAIVAIVRRESPAVLGPAALIVNAAILIYAYS